MDHDLRAIAKRLIEFRDQREWRQFHTPANLAAALSVEAAELQELFLWASPEDQARVLEEKRDLVADEVGDVLISAINFALAAGVDPAGAVWHKIERNESRYPVERVRGSAKKYSEL